MLVQKEHIVWFQPLVSESSWGGQLPNLDEIEDITQL